MLRTRLITGPILITLLLGLMWLDHWCEGQALAIGNNTLPQGLVMLLAFLVITTCAGIELGRLITASGHTPVTLVTIAGSWAMLFTMWASTDSSTSSLWPLVVLIASWSAAHCVLLRTQEAKGVPASAALCAMSVLMLGGLLGFYLVLRQDVSAWWIVAVILIVKSSDIGAYFTGRSIGRRPLILWLSPGKTREGMIGGVLTAALVAQACNVFLTTDGASTLNPMLAFLFGGLLGIIGQAGDLMMSVIKRDAGLKDSASSIPGMGGVLDVLDSLLLAAPVAWFVLAS